MRELELAARVLAKNRIWDRVDFLIWSRAKGHIWDKVSDRISIRLGHVVVDHVSAYLEKALG